MNGGGWRVEDGGWRMESGGWKMGDRGWRVESGRWEKKKITVGYLMESMHSKSLQAFSKGLHCVQIYYTLGPWF